MLKLPNKRYVAVAGCFLGVIVCLLAIDFSDRGPWFAQASAKTDRAGTYDLAKARMLSRVIGHIRAHYVEPERVRPRAMAVAAAQRIQATIPEVMLRVERARDGEPKALVVAVDDHEKTFALDRVGDLYELNWKLMDVFDFLERHLPPLVDLESLEFAAVNGLLGTLDPHSVLLPPRVYREMQLGTKGRFGGLGIVVAVQDGLLTVMSVMPATPASEAGLEPGDQLVQIGTESTVNMSLNEAVNLLRGEAGSEVTVWIRRETWTAARPVSLTRREISVPSVDRESLGDGVGYVRIRNFQENTSDNLYEALDHFRTQPGGLKGLVLDLRNNPGGLLDKAIAVSDAFLDHGTIVTTVREGAREREESHATHANTLPDVPLVVLTNRGSASASEIVAGALKRNERAIILGTTSFGKGSVQVVYKIDEAALKLTIAQYLTPGDVSIQSVGIVPDIEILDLEVDKRKMDIHPAALEARGEAGLASHLDNSHTIESRPSVQLRVLAVDEDATSSAKGSGKADDVANDSLVQLAKSLLAAAPAPNRKQALVQAAGFLSQRQAKEEMTLSARLGELGIDWQPGLNPERPKLDIALTVTAADAGAEGPAAPLVAGTTVVISATVTNTGKRPVYRLYGLVASSLRALHGRELVFGFIPPGGSLTRSTRVKLPKSQSASGDVARLRLFSEQRELLKGGEAILSVKALPRPLFAHTVQIGDPRGNGDGLIQRGERIALSVRVQNVGPGKAHSVLATVKNESGQDVFILKGRDEIGALEPGDEGTATFELEVRKTLKARNVQLKLSIGDQALKSYAHDQLSVRVFPGGFPARDNRDGVATIGQITTPVRSGAHRDAPEVAEVTANAVVAVTGAAGEWLEIAWPHAAGARRGWIPSSRATLGESGGPTVDAVTDLLQHRPPVLTLGPVPLTTRDTKMTLTGTVRFAGSGQKRRHMYIFHGENKVFFKSARSADTLRDELAFSAPITLAPGANELRIVARQGEDDMTEDTITVYRQ